MIQITADRDTLRVGETTNLTVVVTEQSGRPVADPRISWTSSDVTTAVVSGTGQVLALAAGSVVLTARVETASAAIHLTILPAPVHSLTLEGVPDSLLVGQSATLRASARSAEGDLLEGRRITWKSSDTAIVTIDGSGTVFAVSDGVAQISASIDGVSAAATFGVMRMPSPLGGQVLGDLTLTREGSPYALSKLEIGPDGKLAVEPGVVIRGNAYNDVGTIDVWGTIELTGTESAPVVLDAVVLSTFGGSFNQDGHSAVLLERVKMLGGGVRRQTIWGGRLTIDRSIFDGAFVEFHAPTEGSALRTSVFKGSRVEVWNGDGRPLLIENTLFTRNSTLASVVHAEAIRVHGGPVVARFNSFLGFDGVTVRLSSSGRMDARSNFWGTTNPIEIQALLFDRRHSLTVDHFIDWEPFLAAPHPDTPRLQ